MSGLLYSKGKTREPTRDINKPMIQRTMLCNKYDVKYNTWNGTNSMFTEVCITPENSFIVRFINSVL